MAALIVVLAAALGVLAAGALGRATPRLMAGLGVAGAAGSLLACAGPKVGLAALMSIDGVSGVVLLGLFLLVAGSGVRPVVAGAAAMALLAGNGMVLVAGTVAAVLAAGPAHVPGAAWMRGAAAAVVLVAALLALLGLDPSFLVPASPMVGVRAAVAAPAAVLAAVLVGLSVPGMGGLLAFFLVARLLLDLAGPVTPGWWGGPVLLAGGGLALVGARRSAGAEDLPGFVADAGLATGGLAMLGLGTALLARGADLLPLAGLAVAGSLLLVLAWALWAGLLGTVAAVLDAACGFGLARGGGVLRRAPVLGLAALAGLASAVCVPVTPGFAGWWMVLQSVLGTGRSGGLGVPLLMAGVASLLGLVAALLALGAVRAAGLLLLGAPRSARAAVLVEPSAAVRLGLGGMVAFTASAGLVPGVGLLLVRSGAALLATGPAAGATWFVVGPADAPGYLPIGVAVLLAVAGAAAAAALRGPVSLASPWQGGFAEDGVGRGNAEPFRPRWPDLGWLARNPAPAGLAALGLLLAGLLGWAAR